MRAFDNGSLFSVTCTRADVQTFKDQWPCSGLPTTSIWFQFEKSNGDLVDIQSVPDSRHFDGSALVALSEDAMKYGIRRLKLSSLDWRLQ